MLILIIIDFKFAKKNCCQLSLKLHVVIANSKKYTLADCALNINGSKSGGGCISLNFDFRTWYEIEASFSNNPQQKEIIDDIILAHFRINV